MKKMIIGMVALTMIVASAQAASVFWTTLNMSALAVNTASSYTADWEGQAVSFYLVTSGYDLNPLIAQLQASDFTLLSGLTKDGSGVLSGSTKFLASATGAKSDYVNGNTAYGFALVQNINASLAPGTVDFAISSVKSGTFGPVGNLTIDFGGAAGFTTYDVVPEPTSMALLAFGIAAIGLRRRFKK